MEKFIFNCNTRNAPAYSCNKPGDNTGAYYRAGDVAEWIDGLKADLLHAEECGKALEYVFRERGL